MEILFREVKYNHPTIWVFTTTYIYESSVYWLHTRAKNTMHEGRGEASEGGMTHQLLYIARLMRTDRMREGGQDAGENNS